MSFVDWRWCHQHHTHNHHCSDVLKNETYFIRLVFIIHYEIDKLRMANETMESVPNCVVKRSMGVGDEVFNVICNEETENINFCSETFALNRMDRRNGFAHFSVTSNAFCLLVCLCSVSAFCTGIQHSRLRCNNQLNKFGTKLQHQQQQHSKVSRRMQYMDTWVLVHKSRQKRHCCFPFSMNDWETTSLAKQLQQRGLRFTVQQIEYDYNDKHTNRMHRYTHTFDQQQRRRRRLRQRWRHNIHTSTIDQSKRITTTVQSPITQSNAISCVYSTKADLESTKPSRTTSASVYT